MDVIDPPHHIQLIVQIQEIKINYFRYYKIRLWIFKN